MKLNKERIITGYRFWDEIESLAREAFPPEEYLAPSKLAEMAMSDNFDFWALLDDDKFIGFMAVQLYENMVYLFFLAISPQYRSKGYGNRAIETLKETYPDKKQVVDFEMLDETAPNCRQREIRRIFYLRNGYKETGFFLSYLGVDYEVFSMDDFEPEVFKAMMSTLKIDGFKPKYFSK